MAISGAEDPEIEPAIEMTDWAIRILKTYTDAFPDMPERFRDGIIAFMDARQDEKSGLFIDTQGPANARETARNQDAALSTYEILGKDTKYPHPRNTSKADTDDVVIPDFLSSVDSYIDWVSRMNWENGSWTAGDQTQASLQFVNMLPKQKAAEYKEALLAWLGSHQLESGFWSPNMNFNAVSGAFKVGLVYLMCGERLPNPERVVDSIFACYSLSDTENPFFVRNPISVLKQIADYSPELKERVRKGIIANIDKITESFGRFLCPDGAFSAKLGEAMISFGGVVGSHGLYEGDIDATLMMLIARDTLYSIFDTKAPPLDAKGFFERIYT